MSAITGSLKFPEPACMRATRERGFEREIPAQAGESPQSLEHDFPGSNGCFVGPIRGEPLRDRVGVDELVNREGILDQIWSTGALAGAVRTGENDNQRRVRDHINSFQNER